MVLPALPKGTTRTITALGALAMIGSVAVANNQSSNAAEQPIPIEHVVPVADTNTTTYALTAILDKDIPIHGNLAILNPAVYQTAVDTPQVAISQDSLNALANAKADSIEAARQQAVIDSIVTARADSILQAREAAQAAYMAQLNTITAQKPAMRTNLVSSINPFVYTQEADSSLGAQIDSIRTALQGINQQYADSSITEEQAAAQSNPLVARLNLLHGQRNALREQVRPLLPWVGDEKMVLNEAPLTRTVTPASQPADGLVRLTTVDGTEITPFERVHVDKMELSYLVNGQLQEAGSLQVPTAGKHAQRALDADSNTVYLGQALAVSGQDQQPFYVEVSGNPLFVAVPENHRLVGPNGYTGVATEVDGVKGVLMQPEQLAQRAEDGVVYFTMHNDANGGTHPAKILVADSRTDQELFAEQIDSVDQTVLSQIGDSGADVDSEALRKVFWDVTIPPLRPFENVYTSATEAAVATMLASAPVSERLAVYDAILSLTQ